MIKNSNAIVFAQNYEDKIGENKLFQATLSNEITRKEKLEPKRLMT